MQAPETKAPSRSTTEDRGAATSGARWPIRIGWALTTLFTLFMLFDIAIKLIRLPAVEETLAALGYPPGLGVAIGFLEAMLLAVYLVPRTAVLGAILFTGLFGGTIATHFRAGSPLVSHVLFGLYMALFTWGGLWLRHPALRSIVPVQR